MEAFCFVVVSLCGTLQEEVESKQPSTLCFKLSFSLQLHRRFLLPCCFPHQQYAVTLDVFLISHLFLVCFSTGRPMVGAAGYQAAEREEQGAC